MGDAASLDGSSKQGCLLYTLGQPTGVYASAEPDEIGVWAGPDSVWGIWSITGAAALPHRQDPLNPELECAFVPCPLQLLCRLLVVL